MGPTRAYKLESRHSHRILTALPGVSVSAARLGDTIDGTDDSRAVCRLWRLCHRPPASESALRPSLVGATEATKATERGVRIAFVLNVFTVFMRPVCNHFAAQLPGSSRCSL